MRDGAGHAGRRSGTARTIAEIVYAAQWRLARGSDHPQIEQTVPARLIAAIRPTIADGSPGVDIAVANGVLDAFARHCPAVRGPRVTGIKRADRSAAVGSGPT